MQAHIVLPCIEYGLLAGKCESDEMGAGWTLLSQVTIVIATTHADTLAAFIEAYYRYQYQIEWSGVPHCLVRTVRLWNAKPIWCEHRHSGLVVMKLH